MNPSVFQNRTGIKNFLDKKSITISSHLLSQCTENFLGGAFYFFTIFGYRNFFSIVGGIHDFLLKNFLSLSSKWNPRGTPQCFRSVPVTKVFCTLWVMSITISSIFFCLTVPKFIAGNFSAFHYFRASKKFKRNRVMSWFSVENSLSHSTKNIRRWTSLCFRNVLVSKIIWIKWVSRFFCIFLSHVTETFRGGVFYFFTNFGHRKVLSIIGVSHDILLNFFLSHSSKSNRRGAHQCFRNVPVSKVLCILGVSRFCRCFLAHGTEIYCGDHFSVSLIPGIEKV